MNTTSLKTLIAASSLLVAGSASATILEVEPNETFGTATPIVKDAPFFADVGLLSLEPGDIDVFSIELEAGDTLSVFLTPFFGADPEDTDTEIALFDVAGTALVEDDDGFSDGLLSTFNTVIETDGTYYIAVTGFSDGVDEGETFGAEGFIGDHNEEGPYILTVSVVPVPEPSSLALIGMGGLLVARRRR